MRAILQKIVYLGIMSRLPLAFAAVSNVWVMLLLGRRIEEAPRRGSFIVEAPLPLLLVFAAVIALGLHIYGVALNDLLHARYDRMFRPGRPIPSGRVQAAHAAVTAVVGLLVSLLATVFFGPVSVVICLAAAFGILIFNAVGRFFPAGGILTLAAVRVLHMFIVNPALSFGWPAWLAMTHLILAAAIVHRLEGKRPRLAGAEVWHVVAGWAFASLALSGWITWRSIDAAPIPPGIWIAPLILGGLFVAFTGWIVVRHGDEPRRARKTASWYLPLALAWMIAYDVGWLLGAGCAACVILHLCLLAAACATIPAGRWIQEATRYRPAFRVRLLTRRNT